jgi:hypothetical protein
MNRYCIQFMEHLDPFMEHLDPNGMYRFKTMNRIDCLFRTLRRLSVIDANECSDGVHKNHNEVLSNFVAIAVSGRTESSNNRA